MIDLDKTRIKPLDDRRDYTLWRISVLAAISAKGLDQVFEQGTSVQESPSSLSTAGHSGTVEQFQQAGKIIDSELGDDAFRVVCSAIGNPRVIAEKLSD